MIVNHPQFGQVFVAGDGTMYVDTDNGQVAVGNYNTGQTALSMSNPNSSQGEADVNTMRAAGYMPDVSVAANPYLTGAGGQNFNSVGDYYKYLYGDNVTTENINGENWYKTPNGADAILPGREQLTFNPPPSTGSQLVLAGLGGLAGGALLGPALSGLAGTTSGTLAGSMVTGAASGIGAGGLTSAVNGGNVLEGALKGGLLGAAGGGIMQATGLSDYLSSLGGGDVQASGGVDVPDLNQTIGAPADPIEAMYQMTSGNNLTATQAANQAGFSSIQDYLGSINPSWVTGATQLAQGPSLNQTSNGQPTVSQTPTGMSQQELAALVESGTAGNAGAGLEAAAVGGNGLTAGQVGTLASGGALAAPTFGNTTNAFQNSGTVGANGALTAGAGTAATGSAISRLIDGTATASDWASILGNIGATGLGIAGANAQSDAFKDVYNQQMSLGAPYRDKLAQSYQPGFSMADQPDFMNALNLGADAVARATSTKANTFDPGAQMEMQKYVSGNLALPQLNTYRSQLGSFGQLGTNTAGTAALGGAQSNAGTYNALGYGLGQLTQPESPFKGLLSQFGKNNNLFSF